MSAAASVPAGRLMSRTVEQFAAINTPQKALMLWDVCRKYEEVALDQLRRSTKDTVAEYEQYNQAFRRYVADDNAVAAMAFSMLALYAARTAHRMATLLAENPDQVAYLAAAIRDLEPTVLGLQEQVKERSRGAPIAGAGAVVMAEGEEAVAEACARVKALSFARDSSQCRAWFSTVVGLQNAKDALMDGFVYPLVYPRLYGAVSRGILLYGTPGTGKTLLATAAVNELQRDPNVRVMFYAVSGADFKSKFFGESERLIRNVFSCASEAASRCEAASGGSVRYLSVLFLDEAEAVAPSRIGSGDPLAGTTVLALLAAMEGIESKPNVTVIAATNYPWRLDDAFLSRLRTRILVPLPNQMEIVQLVSQLLNTMIVSDARVLQWSSSSIEAAAAGDSCSLASRCDPRFGDAVISHDWRNEPYRAFFRNLQQEDLEDFAADLATELYANRDIATLVLEAKQFAASAGRRHNVFVQIPNPVDSALPPLFMSSLALAPVAQLRGRERVFYLSGDLVSELTVTPLSPSPVEGGGEAAMTYRNNAIVNLVSPNGISADKLRGLRAVYVHADDLGAPDALLLEFRVRVEGVAAEPPTGEQTPERVVATFLGGEFQDRLRIYARSAYELMQLAKERARRGNLPNGLTLELFEVNLRAIGAPAYATERLLVNVPIPNPTSADTERQLAQVMAFIERLSAGAADATALFALPLVGLFTQQPYDTTSELAPAGDWIEWIAHDEGAGENVGQRLAKLLSPVGVESSSNSSDPSFPTRRSPFDPEWLYWALDERVDRIGAVRISERAYGEQPEFGALSLAAEVVNWNITIDDLERAKERTVPSTNQERVNLLRAYELNPNISVAELQQQEASAAARGPTAAQIAADSLARRRLREARRRKRARRSVPRARFEFFE